MADALIKEIQRIQADICVIEGMVGAVLENAYGGTKTEYIGNSLEVLKEYIGKRAGELDALGTPFRMLSMGEDDVTGNALPDCYTYWENYIADGQRNSMLSKEAACVKDKVMVYLGRLPEKSRSDLLLLAEELGTAYRKQGFAEGMMAAAGMVCGEEGMDGQGAI